MSFEFVENVTLYIPDVKESLASFAESSSDNKLIIEIAAIHQGLTSNFNMYTANELENSLASWVQPYPRPIILNHDIYTDPIGRVMAAKMDKEEDGTPFVRLQAAITNPEAVKKILDNRYLTGSVGGKAESAVCSICKKNWAESAAQMPACRHQRGQVYNGQLAYFELNGLAFKEYSFVNVPADPKSGIRPSVASTTVNSSGSELEDKWVRPMKVFSLDMNKESVMELNESGESSNVLVSMKKKQAHFTYMNLKGTFLSSTAHDFSEKDELESDEKLKFMQSYTTIDKEPNESSDINNTQINEDAVEENQMSEKATSAVEEDILSITEKLSADLASTSEEVSTVDEEVTTGASDEELLEDSSEEADPEEEPMDSEDTEDTASLVSELKTMLANTVSVYHDALGCHWNVKGVDFAQYHALFSDIYESLGSSIDPIAESILKLGQDSPFRLSDIVSMRTVNELSGMSTEPQALAQALHDEVVQLIEGTKACFEVAEDTDEQGIANMISTQIEQLQKWEWQLRVSAEGSVPERMSESTGSEQLAEPESKSDELAVEDQAIESNSDIDTMLLENETLKEENIRLKNSLHFMLAERVVDAKITVGVLESDQRAEALKDHASRSASSLADSLRDLEKYSRNHVKTTSTGNSDFSLDIKAMATGASNANEAFIDEDVQAQGEERTAENILVDVLMGRTKL